MLHRMKLRALYGGRLSSDCAAKRRKAKTLLIAGVAVYPLFLWITYAMIAETGALRLVLIGLLAAATCVPVVLYSYREGIGQPWRRIWKERPAELRALALKIGFFYGFEMYWMILGVVEFLFGYHTFRAALISFVALAVARDGFEIGYHRAEEENGPRTRFPDGRSIGAFWRDDPTVTLTWIAAAIVLGSAGGAFLAPFFQSGRVQTLTVGLIGGGIATLAYARMIGRTGRRPSFFGLAKFFIWPALTMACRYFFIFAYLYKIIFKIEFGPAVDLGIWTAVCSAWITKDTLFLGYLKGELAA